MGGKRDYELFLEIGHKSEPLKKKAPNGYTHKWTVYLKGVDDAKIENCISRVVFQLHESFDNHHRVIMEPPYRVKETGYAGFELPIEVYFRNKDKPNHVVYVHNLELLNVEKHVASHVEKVMFLNPNREFEKCLIRAGARAHVSKSKDKKDRSDSPPVKKRKSASALIPSKDMGKLNLQPHDNGHPNNHVSSSHSNHSSSSQHHIGKLSQQNNHGHNHTSSINGTNNSNGTLNRGDHSISSNSNSKHESIHGHAQSKLNVNHQSSKSFVPKVKSESKDFVDLFGAPLVYSKKQVTSNSSHFKDVISEHRTPTPNGNNSPNNPTPNTVNHSRSKAVSSHKQGFSHSKSQLKLESQQEREKERQERERLEKEHHERDKNRETERLERQRKEREREKEKEKEREREQELRDIERDRLERDRERDFETNIPLPPYNLTPLSQTSQSSSASADAFHALQSTIAGLTDCDRLQRIVDIIEESGEWFNLTHKKFEFDLKRLDKRTLHKIEKCLH